MSGAAAMACACCPTTLYYLFGRCCTGDGEDHTYYSSTITSGEYVIDGECFAQNGTTYDPADLVGLTELPVLTACECFSLVATSNCGLGVCIDCVDVYILVEIFNEDESYYEIGWWKLTGTDYPWYFDGDDCDRDLADVPPWEASYGWLCEGADVIYVTRAVGTYYAVRDCDYTPPTYPMITSYSPGDFTYGSEPSC